MISYLCTENIYRLTPRSIETKNAHLIVKHIYIFVHRQLDFGCIFFILLDELCLILSAFENRIRLSTYVPT